MFRRFVVFLFFLVFIGAVIGAVIASGLALLSGANRWLIVGATVAGLIGFALIARQLYLTTWKPLGALVDATRRLGAGDHTVRLPVRGFGPSDRLATSFNKMAERLEEEDRRRRRLIADIGHELRTPMTVIRGEIEAVLDGLHSPEQLGDVVAEVEVVDRLLEDLRLLAMAESGTLKLETEPTDLAELTVAVASSFQARADKQDVSVSVDTVDSAEATVDPHRIYQVLANLIRNALDQMPRGGQLEVRVQRESSHIRIEIADDGAGLSDEDLDRVFDRFVRSPDSTGTGLGLSISRDLVELHGGTIGAANREAGGAIFTVTIPVA